MGIKLDWQVESEQSHLRATEDPDARRNRHRALRQLVLLLVTLAAIVALAVAAIIWRLDRVDSQYRQDLLDTVEVEVTALRLGDYASFIAVHRTSSDSFLLEQSQVFETYQDLKRANRVELTGEVVDVAIDDPRGRVVVEEIIDGVPQHVVWFYWYYENGSADEQGGWRRVPDDLTFWGEERTIEAEAITVEYHALDEALAQALAPRLADWWARGCTVLGCNQVPPSVTVEIVAERPAALAWASYDPWTLRLTSPLVERARADVPLPPDLELDIARAVAARLVRFAAGDLRPLPPSDAVWLQDELARWLTNALLYGENAPATAGFLEALVAAYGPGAPATVLDSLRLDSTVDSVIQAVTGVAMPLLTVEQLNALDWRGFFGWRLALEYDLLADANSGAAFLALYDLDNPYIAGLAEDRLVNPSYAAEPVPQVTEVEVIRDAESQVYAYAGVNDGSGEPATVIWRLANGSWQRAN